MPLKNEEYSASAVIPDLGNLRINDLERSTLRNQKSKISTFVK